MLDFNDDRTYTKDVVLANVRYALLDPKSLQDDAFSAEFLDMAVLFFFFKIFYKEIGKRRRPILL